MNWAVIVILAVGAVIITSVFGLMALGFIGTLLLAAFQAF